jgi:hypothetical protein
LTKRQRKIEPRQSNQLISGISGISGIEDDDALEIAEQTEV